MNNEKQVAELIEKLKVEQVPLSDAVWKTALACIGFPYVFGAWGELCNPSNRSKRVRDSHPTIKSACQVLRDNDRKPNCNGCKWFPNGERVRMYDCRGFTHWALNQFGINISGSGATSQWNTDSNWSARGTIGDIPDDILVCLFVKNGNTMEHTGFGYNGSSVECSNGVQYFEKRKAKWTHWALPRGISDMPDYRPTLRRGDKGEYVTLLQTQLVNRGYDIGKSGIDGDFGKATEAAVKQFQKDNGLKVDGIVGKDTWNAIAQSSPVYFTVTIPHLRETQADKLISEYVGATKTEERG